MILHDLKAKTPYGIKSSNNSVHTCSTDIVYRNTGFFQYFQCADMSYALSISTA